MSNDSASRSAARAGARLDIDEVSRLIALDDVARAATAYQKADPDPDSARALFGLLSRDQAATLIRALPDEAMARELLLWLPREQASSIVEALDAQFAGRLIASLHSDDRADLLAELDESHRSLIQAALPAEARADAARLLTYPPDSAGGLMETEYLAFSVDSTVREAIRDLRANQERYAAIGVQYVYLLGDGRTLKGVAPIRDLMLAPEEASLSSLIRRPPIAVRDRTTSRELGGIFDEHPYMALPVVDDAGVMLGVVTRENVTESQQEEAEDDFRVSLGIVGGEELRSMPVTIRLRRRSAWLGVNLLLCLGGAAIVAFHRDTLAKAIVVAAVLPVISATSGNAAMQAAAVSIRELTLGVIDHLAWRRVLAHELSLAALLALPLGLGVGGLARLWGAPWTIGLAVGVAMAVNSLIAIGVGALCPLALRRLRVDPALASGPISTTIADVSGFALTLGLVAAASG